MENNMMFRELEGMKAQMELLKEKLEKQEIVKEQHLRNAIKGKLGEINRRAVRMIFVGLFATVYCTWMLNHLGFSLNYQIVTIVMLSFCTLATYVQHKNLLKARDLSSDLIKETFDLLKLKKRYNSWLKFALPMIAVWCSWLAYEVLYVIPDRGIGLSLLIGAAVGVVIGGFVGLKIHFGTLKKIDEMLTQINELKGE